MNIYNIFKRKKKIIIEKKKIEKNNLIKREVDILSVKDENKIDFSYAFAFDFIKGQNGKKKAVVSVNDEKVILEEGQSVLFIMKSGDLNPIRLKATPDFQKEGCHTTVCHDANIKDEDI